ncbi:MAG: phosphatidylglycerophosphatase A [Nitrospirota bacterium]
MIKLIIFIATGFYSGYLPIAPGTAGSLVGLVIYLLVKDISPFSYSLFLIVFFAVGVYFSHIAENDLQEKDSRHIVIDEIYGILLTFFLLPFRIQYLIFGFFLFRIFDILKPFPIKKAEKIRGGFGIMTDDVIAGLYANILLHLFRGISL